MSDADELVSFLQRVAPEKATELTMERLRFLNEIATLNTKVERLNAAMRNVIDMLWGKPGICQMARDVLRAALKE